MRMEKMAKNLGRLLPHASPPPSFYTSKAVQSSKSLGGDIPNNFFI